MNFLRGLAGRSLSRAGWWIAAGAALISAAGTWDQVHLQESMQTRLVAIHQTLVSAQKETGAVNTELNDLKPINQASRQLLQELKGTQSRALAIKGQLAGLDGIVGGIDSHVTRITDHTFLANVLILGGNRSTGAVGDHLQTMSGASQSVIQILQRMVTEQENINQALARLNQKLP